MGQVLVIGGGVAGLAAAQKLSSQGIEVTLLEARNRLGGRIHTVRGRGGVPIELGAEFVHGARNAVWEQISTGRLATVEVPDRHWSFHEGLLNEDKELFSKIEEVLSKIDPRAPDKDFRAFLDSHPELSAWARTLSLEYVEGFHAADPGRVSIQSLARSEQAAEKDEGTRQFRISNGYVAMVDQLKEHLDQAGVKVKLSTVVEAISWQQGAVEVQARTERGPERFNGRKALITLPLGVLQQRDGGGIRFDPKLREHEEAIRGLVMGTVVKVTLEFRKAFWPVSNFGFIHAIGCRFPTWWSDDRGPVLTAWAGGPRARELEGLQLEELQGEALAAAAAMFKVDPARVRDSFVAAYHHDWAPDPFSRGAYSYTPDGMGDKASVLGVPINNTLFFAGEASDATGEEGTVQGALESGRRAAAQMIEGLEPDHRTSKTRSLRATRPSSTGP